MNDERRGTGRTTRMMAGAPRGATCVWVNDHVEYPEQLALTLGRDDLKIVPASWLTPQNLAGTDGEVLLDHAFWFKNAAQWEMWTHDWNRRKALRTAKGAAP